MSKVNTRGFNMPLFLGFSLLLSGVILLQEFFGVLSSTLGQVLISWQFFLVLLSLFLLLHRQTLAGVILLFIGGFFLLKRVQFLDPNLLPFDLGDGSLILPIVLSLFGLFIIYLSLGRGAF